MAGMIAGGLAAAFGAGLIAAAAWRKNIHRWLPAYLNSGREAPDPSQPLHIYFCFADHFEPLWNHASVDAGRQRVQRWLDDYPRVAGEFRDSDGRPAQHTFFFPAEEYRPVFLDMLRQLCSKGYGDVEVHIHHDNDTEANFVETMLKFIDRCQQHGFLLGRDPGKRFGFIHGNWCLDNSRRDGRWCGLNNEIDLLIKLGCYADFTFPSAPSETQPRMANCIYYSRDDVKQPGSHDTGRLAEAGVEPADDELCMITGPLGLNFSSRKFGIFPRIENADINSYPPAGPERVTLWTKLGARVKGAPNHIFIKVHTHGTQEKLHDTMLGERARTMYRSLAALQRDGVRLHFVTAYEMWQKVRILESGVRSLERARPITRSLPALEPQLSAAPL